MKKLYLQMGIAMVICLLPLGMTQTSCSADDDEPEVKEQQGDGRRPLQMTVADVPLTRATLTDNSSRLGANWNAGDAATYFNVSSFTTDRMDYGTLSASSSAATSAFTGTVRCSVNDNIALLYPATDPIMSGENRGKFTISLSGQKGTLGDVAQRYHYVYGVGKVTSVTETTANASISSMQSLLALAKFEFNDGTNPIAVKTLSIQYYDDLYGPSELNYPLTGTVTPTAGDVAVVPTAQKDWDGPLVITLDSETSDGVYVALFPVSGYNIFFSVENSEGTYTGTASATLKAGKYYPATLKLTKQE